MSLKDGPLMIVFFPGKRPAPVCIVRSGRVETARCLTTGSKPPGSKLPDLQSRFKSPHPPAALKPQIGPAACSAALKKQLGHAASKKQLDGAPLEPAGYPLRRPGAGYIRKTAAKASNSCFCISLL